MIKGIEVNRNQEADSEITNTQERWPAEFGDRGGLRIGIGIPQFFCLLFFEKK